MINRLKQKTFRHFIPTRFHLICLGILIIMAADSAQAQSPANYIIIKNPAQIRILNAYQMALPKEHPIRSMTSAPFKILDITVVLSDEITRAMKVKFLHETYFIPIDEYGRPSGLESKNDVIRLNNCREICDTIRVISPHIQIRSSRSPAAPQLEAEGQAFFRLFRKNGDFALLPLGAPRQLLWSSLSPGSGWQRINKTILPGKATPTHQRKTEEQIIALFDKMNRLYQLQMKAFNRAFTDTLRAPYWQITENDKTIQAELRGRSISQLPHSTDALVKEIGLLLAGTSYKLIRREAALIITKNGN